MAYDIPGVGKSLNDVVTLTHPKLDGVLKINSVDLTSVAADLNLVAGLVAAAITTGFAKYFEKEVDCSIGATATVVAIVTVPAGSIILDVLTYCTEAFNGATLHTFEVGISGNTDKYIDPVDCPHTLAGVMSMMTGTNQDQKTAEPIGAAMVIQAVWTNTGSVTAGKMKVKVIYA